MHRNWRSRVTCRLYSMVDIDDMVNTEERLPISIPKEKQPTSMPYVGGGKCIPYTIESTAATD
eukprot:COSAG01_NODE_4534_length_4945_cov_171.303756_6_plen_63_part_00